MSVAGADPVDGSVLVTTNQLPPTALSVHEQLKDVSNPSTEESPEPAVEVPSSLAKPDASNGEISHDHVEPERVANDATVSDSHETVVQGTDVRWEKADEAQGAPVQNVDNVVSDSVATDNVGHFPLCLGVWLNRIVSHAGCKHSCERKKGRKYIPE